MTGPADLLFRVAPPADADLLFGATGTGAGDAAARITVRIGLPALGMAVTAARIELPTSVATPRVALPGLGVRAAAQWDARVQRPLASHLHVIHSQGAAASAPGVMAPQQEAQTVQSGVQAAYSDAISAGRPATPARHRDAIHVQQSSRPRHQDGAPLRRSRSAAHQDADRLRRQILARHQDGVGRRTDRSARHQDGIRTRRPISTRMQPAEPVRRSLADAVGAASPSGRWITGDHQDAMRPPIGRYVLPPIDPPHPPHWIPSAHLLFCQPRPTNGDLLFGWVCGAGAGTIVVPTLRTYIVLNTVSLTRVSNSLPIPALSLQISIDADSWGWGWSASVPAAQLDNLLPDGPGAPVELQAQINGVTWRLLAERIARDRRHASDRLAVSGRGIAAELSAPLYPEESRSNVSGALTSQQLAAAALTVNGVSLGWELDWQIPDWLVPVGAWVHTGTPMDAVSRIAQAAGGYVQADPLLKTLHILPRYPALPWDWAAQTPAFILPSSATTREATEYIEKPDYNAVYVSGSAIGGVLGRVQRTGTAGDMPAEMVVDPLITHVDAARGRGSAILGDTGPQQILTLETPVLEAVGVYPVGSLIEWQEGAASRRGLVRSLSVSAALPRVRQTIEVEVHG